MKVKIDILPHPVSIKPRYCVFKGDRRHWWLRVPVGEEKNIYTGEVRAVCDHYIVTPLGYNEYTALYLITRWRSRWRIYRIDGDGKGVFIDDFDTLAPAKKEAVKIFSNDTP